MSSTLEGATRAVPTGPVRNGVHTRPCLADTSSWQVTKRDGRLVAFDVNRIRSAVWRCFREGLGAESAAADQYAGEVVPRVLNVLASRRKERFDVEEVQQAVIAQLWAGGHAHAGEHYTLYREEHRKARAQAPVDPDWAARSAADAAHFATPLQYYQLISKFARWDDSKKRRETWAEAVDGRVLPWFQKTLPGRLEPAEWQVLRDGLFHLEASCSLRALQMAGPAADRCHSCLYNCSYLPVVDLRCLPEFIYLLMQGCGVGFSVESRYVDQLSRVKKQRRCPVETFVIPDHTEGWCDAVLAGLTAWFDGRDVNFDPSQVRKKNSRLRTKGGRASGPGPLLDLLAAIRATVLGAQGRRLTDLEWHDIYCRAARISGVGGVRRAASISFSDLDSRPMRDCKSGNWWEKHEYRRLANNSAVYEEKPDPLEFMEEWLALGRSRSGERGIFNLEGVLKNLPGRRKRIKDLRGNPCGEIQLRPFQFCNLSIAVARPDDTEDDLERKVRLATLWGKLQSLCTNFRYIRPEWKENCDEEMLLGVDLTGHADCPLLRYGAPGRAALLRRLAKVVDEVDGTLSARWDVPLAGARRCIKPGGDSAVLFKCASGVSPWPDDYIIRRTTESASSPVCRLLKDQGVPWVEHPTDPNLVLFEWPTAAPAGATKARDLTALQQLENWLEWKENWADHAVSVSIYIGDDEWFEAGAWCYEHFDQLAGLAFFPRDNGSYRAAPLESISQERYRELVAQFPRIDWSKLCRYEQDDETVPSGTPACQGDRCGL